MKANPTIVHRDHITVLGWSKLTLDETEMLWVWHKAQDWLSDWGVDLGLLPDDCATTDTPDVTAFRIESAGKHVIVLVRLDVDGAPDGRTCVDWVEVSRGC